MLFVLRSFRCYTKQAVAETNENDGAESPSKEGKAAKEHLENYIVQETKNKPVILRQEHRKVFKLRNEITQRI